MTEQPDTTEIRRYHLPERCGRASWVGPGEGRCYLCEAVDALDLLRAERVVCVGALPSVDRARIAAVLVLHFDSGGGYCAECSSHEDGIELPCPTVRALTEGNRSVTDIDTAAIRAELDDPNMSPSTAFTRLREAVDALDAARAERDTANMVAAQTLGYLERAESAEAKVQAQAVQIHSMFEDCRVLRARAEAAERKAVDFEGRYETSHASRMWAEECFRNAEARIDAALDESGDADRMWRALTESAETTSCVHCGMTLGPREPHACLGPPPWNIE